MLQQILFPENEHAIAEIPLVFHTQFPHIVTDPEIHGGQPHIKGTRILAVDIFRAQVKGYTLSKMIMEFKEMGITVSQSELEEAFKFMVEWIQYSLNGKENTKTAK